LLDLVCSCPNRQAHSVQSHCAKKKTQQQLSVCAVFEAQATGPAQMFNENCGAKTPSMTKENAPLGIKNFVTYQDVKEYCSAENRAAGK
jgi:hypothetical protein